MTEVVFHALAAVAILSAVAAAVAPRIVHAAFGLMAAFLAVAGLYALLGADFVAFAQVLVYVGGILVLLVFGVLLTARTETDLGATTRARRGVAVGVGGLLFLALLLALDATRWPGADAVPAPAPTTKPIGRTLLDPEGMLVPFEVASVLLLAALVGAAYLARRRRSS
jgi:NADH-quinone oxidoreductase subunit J